MRAREGEQGAIVIVVCGVERRSRICRDPCAEKGRAGVGRQGAETSKQQRHRRRFPTKKVRPPLPKHMPSLTGNGEVVAPGRVERVVGGHLRGLGLHLRARSRDWGSRGMGARIVWREGRRAFGGLAGGNHSSLSLSKRTRSGSAALAAMPRCCCCTIAASRDTARREALSDMALGRGALLSVARVEKKRREGTCYFRATSRRGASRAEGKRRRCGCDDRCRRDTSRRARASRVAKGRGAGSPRPRFRFGAPRRRRDGGRAGQALGENASRAWCTARETAGPTRGVCTRHGDDRRQVFKRSRDKRRARRRALAVAVSA